MCDGFCNHCDPHGMQKTSDLVREAIAHVRDSHPYWNASGGADHFMVFSYDHGKCEMAKALQFEEFGKMFSVQAYGSPGLQVRLLPVSPDPTQGQPMFYSKTTLIQACGSLAST